MKATLETNKLKMSEVIQKVGEISPKISGMRDKFQAGMESMQDILLESPLSQEVADLKKEVGQIKTVIFGLIKTDADAQLQSLKESFLPVISSEMAAIKREFASQITALKDASRGLASTRSLISDLKEDVLNSVNTIVYQLQASSSTSSLSGTSVGQ